MPARARLCVARAGEVPERQLLFKVDQKDEALLRELERNARASVVDLARRIGLSRSATQERLGRLEREGVIAGYTIARGETRAAARVAALLLVRHAPGSNCARAIPELRKLSEIVGIQALAGEPDLALQALAPDAASLDAIASRIRAMPGVASVTTHVVLADHLRRP